MDSSVESLEKARVGEVFRSRKNRVFRVIIDGDDLVAKVYPIGSGERALNEYSVLEACAVRGVRVPRPVKRSDRAILTELVEGKTAAESIDSAPSDAERILLGVIDWLSDFHKAHGFRFCRGDCVLHNFVMTPQGAVGVDFEEAHEGDPIEDLGQVIASYFSMRPAFLQEKMVVAKGVVSEYMIRSGFDRGQDVPIAVSRALRHYAVFRDDGDLLNMWADRIERGGLDSGQE